VLLTWAGMSPWCRSPLESVPDGSNIKIAPPGDDGLCSVPLGDDEDVAGAQLGGALPAVGAAQRDGEPAGDHQEKFIGVLVDVPDVLALGVRDLNVVIVNPADNARAVNVVEGGQCLAQADGEGCHAFSIGPAKTPVLYDLDVDAEPAGRCHIEAWAPRMPMIREVFHAHLVDYAYPSHCHETWAVLIVDEGAIQYDLDRRRRRPHSYQRPAAADRAVTAARLPTRRR
jgi:hypothetical protein